MNIWSSASITASGLNLLAKLIRGTTLNITRAETGSGYVTPGSLAVQRAVSSPKQSLSFVSLEYPEEGTCKLVCRLVNDSLDTGYMAMQVGIYATDPDAGEILFFIAQSPEGAGTPIPSKTEMGNYTAEWAFYFKYGLADNVTVVVDPAAAVTKKQLDEAIAVAVKGLVPITRTINGKALDEDITLSADDIEGLQKMEAITNAEIDSIFDEVFGS